MKKHTTGPWKAFRKADYTTPGWVILWPDTSKPGVHHRRLDSNGGFVEEDARLIAAAPDLLEALLGLASTLENIGGEHVTGLQGSEKRLDAAYAAIAKATGESA